MVISESATVMSSSGCMLLSQSAHTLLTTLFSCGTCLHEQKVMEDCQIWKVRKFDMLLGFFLFLTKMLNLNFTNN